MFNFHTAKQTEAPAFAIRLAESAKWGTSLLGPVGGKTITWLFWGAMQHCTVNVHTPDMQVLLDSYQTPARFFVDKNKILLKCIETGKGTKIAKTILKKKNKVGGISLPDFKPHYKAAWQ